AALDRETVGAGGEACLCALEGSELFAEVVSQTLVELVLVEIGSQVPGIDFVRLFAGVSVGESGQRPLDSRTLLRQQLASPLGVHHATLPFASRSQRAGASRAAVAARARA